jgi:hypothetical protein
MLIATLEELHKISCIAEMHWIIFSEFNRLSKKVPIGISIGNWPKFQLESIGIPKGI